MRLVPDVPGVAPDGRADGQTAAVAELASPSLFAAGAGGAPAFELKFLLTEEQARAVAARLASRLALDPHADHRLGGAYLITSVYTDTPAFDVLTRTGAAGRRKYRVRKYGTAGPVFLERKTKTGDRVRKRRSEVPGHEVGRLAGPASPADWAGSWFHRRLHARSLHPVCRIAYERVAYMGPVDGHAVRATFDRRVRGVLAAGWAPDPVGPAPTLLDGRVICEFKFRLALPALLRDIIQNLGLTPSTVSKYRLFMLTARGAVARGG